MKKILVVGLFSLMFLRVGAAVAEDSTGTRDGTTTSGTGAKPPTVTGKGKTGQTSPPPESSSDKKRKDIPNE